MKIKKIIYIVFTIFSILFSQKIVHMNGSYDLDDDQFLEFISLELSPNKDVFPTQVRYYEVNSDGYQNLIWEFLYNLIKKNPSKLFNVLIETYQIDDDTNNTFNNKDVIYHIINKFKCFSKEKNKKQFINAMIHYVDYRIMTSFGFVANKFHINLELL